MPRTSGNKGGGGGGLPAWFQHGAGDPITANPTVPNTVGGLYFDTSGATGLWVAVGASAGDWAAFGALAPGTVGGLLSGINGFALISPDQSTELSVSNGSTTISNAVGSVMWDANSVYFPTQAPTASPPAYVLGGMYFDTTLNKLRIGGALGWETVTSV
jgi:hypothetical protein